MKRKTFKKWLMSIGGISRNDADYICKLIARHNKRYTLVYAENVSDPWLTGILDSIEMIDWNRRST